MAAQALPGYTRYTSRGASRVYWVASIATMTSPTRTELNNGWDLTPQVTDSSGWSVSSDQIDAPDMANRFTAKIPGMISADDSSLTMYANQSGSDVRTLMPQDTPGFIVWLDGGDVAGYKMDVWKVTVSSVSKQRSVQGSDPDTLVFTFTPTAAPAVNVTVP